MNINKVSLYNFRNFAQVEEIMIPDSALLVAAAPNATGKTNFLESLVMLLRGKSFRAGAQECIKWGEDSFILKGGVSRGGGHTEIAVQYHGPSRKIRIEEDKVPASLVTFFGNYPLVTFLPEDTFLFARGPAQRRSFINRVLVSIPAYVSSLVQFQRALKQRNSNLKRVKEEAEVESWTDILIDNAVTIWNYRVQLVDYLNSQTSDIYRKISGEERRLSVKLSGVINGKEEIKKAFSEVFEQERRYGYTLIGPHRDDLIVENEGYAITNSMSQGQARSVVISLKLATLNYLEQVTQEKPILLLDEVLSELDEKRQESLLSNLPEVQTLLTCTSVPKVLYKRNNVHLLDLRNIIAQEEEVGQEEGVKEEAVKA